MTLLLLFSGRYIPPDPSPERTFTAPKRDRDMTAKLRSRSIQAPPRKRDL
jgi:hypothetical protein